MIIDIQNHPRVEKIDTGKPLSPAYGKSDVKKDIQQAAA